MVTSFEQLEPLPRSRLPILAAWLEDLEVRERMDGTIEENGRGEPSLSNKALISEVMKRPELQPRR